jgi:hypothetical protein
VSQEVPKVHLARVEPTGLEPVTPCLQSKCATYCAMAPGQSFPCGGSVAAEDETRIRRPPLMIVHGVCNQAGGTVHSLLSDGTE